MSSSATPGERYREGLALLPNWNEQGEEDDARYQRGLALITEAAEAGHLDAIKDLADGMAREASFEWSVKLAALGDVGPLLSNITSGDYPDEQSRAVFAAARSGVPWAQLAVGRLYRMGMRDRGGVLIATRDDAFGCLPGAADPQAEGFAWLKRAHAAGWTAATLWLADTLRHEEPVRALEYARATLAGSGPLMPSERVRACKVLAELLDESDAPLAERVTLYTRLAEEGDADAHVWLGDRCRLGEGGAVDLAAARAQPLDRVNRRCDRHVVEELVGELRADPEESVVRRGIAQPMIVEFLEGPTVVGPHGPNLQHRAVGERRVAGKGLTGRRR